MTFPLIRHIDDVLPHIAGRDEFVVAEREGYRVIDYNFAIADSFDDPVRLECRGLKFWPDGSIMARPLHKFFNIGERPETQADRLDFAEAHAVTEKLDGSMIHPGIVGDDLVLMTRMGRTDVARKAERHLTASARFWLNELIRDGFTPIFEFTAPDNRIVISYPTSTLSLLAMRKTETGAYAPLHILQEWSQTLGVPLVTHHPSDWTSGQAFADYARAVTGREGFVVRFGGLWVKAKGEDYVLKHRAKDSVLKEKNVLALVLSNGLDDVLPLLDAADREAVSGYKVGVLTGMAATAQGVRDIVTAGAELDQKSFATTHLADIDPLLKPLCFAVRAGAEPLVAVRVRVAKGLGSQAGVDAMRPLFLTTFDLTAANDNAEAVRAAA